MKIRWSLWVFLLIGGCASHDVRCGGHLTAINAPASSVSEPPAAARSTR